MANNRKVILYIATSIDGYIANEDGTLGWLESTEVEGDTGYEALLARVDTVVMGKGTYDVVRGFDIAYPYQSFTNYVFSNTTSGSDEFATFTNEDVTTFIRRLQQQPGKDIWVIGGGKLVSEFFKNDLIDEFQLGISPIILGKGISLYVGESERRFRLERVEQLGQMAMLHYVRKAVLL